MKKDNKKVTPKDTSKKPKSQIAKNGRVLRAVADWLSELATKDGKGFTDAKKRRADRISKDNNKAGDEILYILGQTGRTGGFIFLKLFELISRTTNIALVDNAMFRKLEQKYSELKRDDKKFAAWLKKHPAMSSYLTVLLTTALLLLGRAGYKKIKDPVNKDNKAKIEIVEQPQKAPTVKTYDVTDDGFVQEFFDENWNNFVIFLSEFETFREKPVLQPGEDRYTYGPGLTWVWEQLANGKYKQHECIGKWKTKAASFTKEQMWEQAQIHLLNETLPTIQAQLKAKGFKHVPSHQLFALVVAGYQLPGHISGIVSKLQQAGDDVQKCADAFSYWASKKRKDYYRGTMKRRWWCANIYLGYIDCHDLLDLNCDVFSAVDFNMVKPNDKQFAMDSSTLTYALLKTNDKSSVRDFIVQNKLLSNPDNCYTKSGTVMIATADPSIMEMIAGLKDFRAKKYESSIAHYQKAIDLNPDNISAYSDLALVYKTYADGIKDKSKSMMYYKRCCEQLSKIESHMAENEDLVVDDESMAYVHYNVATAQDELAKIYKNKGDKANAATYYKYAMENYGKAEKYGIDAGIADKYINKYKDKKAAAEANYKAMKKDKTIAFNRANSKLKIHDIMQKQSQIINNKGDEYA